MSQAHIIGATPLPNFRVRLRFRDGVEGEVDLSHLAGKGVFGRWLTPGDFEKVRVDPQWGCVMWPAGGESVHEVDLCPDVLYHEVTGKPLPGQGGEQTEAA